VWSGRALLSGERNNVIVGGSCAAANGRCSQCKAARRTAAAVAARAVAGRGTAAALSKGLALQLWQIHGNASLSGIGGPCVATCSRSQPALVGRGSRVSSCSSMGPGQHLSNLPGQPPLWQLQPHPSSSQSSRPPFCPTVMAPSTSDLALPE
jgi:hypothetical protein